MLDGRPYIAKFMLKQSLVCNDSGSSFAAGCMRYLLPGSAPISLQ